MPEKSPRVKICGITSLADAELAVELGAWAIGMIFYDGSPRQCSLEEAQRITAALHRKVELCGVFVNDPLEQVVRISEDLGLTMVQLHGEEGPAFCGEVPRRTGARVIKAAQVAGPGDVRDLERYHVDFHLLDGRAGALEKQALRGGTGETFDWALLGGRRSKVPLILSGGLRAGNVAAAIARTGPFAVDSASGTESAPGKKDAEKLRAFVAAVEQSAVEAVA
ncbi:MAG TPA: phosphoribosylanthranilate isomerase [Solirubrobacteraceae bacterium]